MSSVENQTSTANSRLQHQERQEEDQFIQLAGHQNSILPTADRTIWKITSAQDEETRMGKKLAESNAYMSIAEDKDLKKFLPKFYGCETHGSTSYIVLEDVTIDFPASRRTLLDIKMGHRSFSILETSVKKRTDLFEKIKRVDESALTPDEHADGAVTKKRYMSFRDMESSTALLGFRLEGTRLPGQNVTKGYERLHARDQVQEVLLRHVGNRVILAQLCTKLRKLKIAIEESNFFRTHEVIGNSILVVHDGVRCGLWLIDFANTLRLNASSPLDHRAESSDGYLKGMDELISVLEEKL